MSPKNQQDYCELPLPYETEPRFFFVFSQDMCALSSSHHWPMLSMSVPWGWKFCGFLVFGCVVWADLSKWKVMICYKKMVKRHWNVWDLSFLQGKFWDWDILVGLILIVWRQGLCNREPGAGTNDLCTFSMGSLWHWSSGWFEWDHLEPWFLTHLWCICHSQN